MTSASKVAMATPNKFPSDMSSKRWFSQLLVLDLGGGVYAISDPSDQGGRFVCLGVSVEVTIFFFKLFVVVVPWGSQWLQRRKAGPWEWEVLTAIAVETRLRPSFISLGVSMTRPIVLRWFVLPLCHNNGSGIFDPHKASAMTAFSPGRWSNWTLTWQLPDRMIQRQVGFDDEATAAAHIWLVSLDFLNIKPEPYLNLFEMWYTRLLF